MKDASCGHSKNMHYHFGDSSTEAKDGEGIPEMMQRISKKKTLYYGAKCGGCVGQEHNDCKHPIAWRENDYGCEDFRRYK